MIRRLLDPFGLADKLRTLANRAFGTEVPAPLARVCPGCAQALSFMCREIRLFHNIQTVRCVGCMTISIWDWDGGIPYLVAYEQERLSA